MDAMITTQYLITFIRETAHLCILSTCRRNSSGKYCIQTDSQQYSQPISGAERCTCENQAVSDRVWVVLTKSVFRDKLHNTRTSFVGPRCLPVLV